MNKKLGLFIIWVLIGFGIEALANPVDGTWSGLGHLFVNYIVLLSLFPFGAGLILFYGETKKNEPIPCLILTILLLLLANASILLLWIIPNLFDLEFNLPLLSSFTQCYRYIPVLSFGAAYFASMIRK